MHSTALRSLCYPQETTEKIERQTLFTCAVEDNDIVGDKNLRAGNFGIFVGSKPAKISATLCQQNTRRVRVVRSCRHSPVCEATPVLKR